MRFISYRLVLSVLLAFAGLSLSACSDISRQAPQLTTNAQSEKLTINQPDSDISNRLARVWMRVARQAMADGDPETAARFFQKAGGSAPESPRPLLGLATAYERQGEQQKAADAFRTALKIDPKNQTARISLGNLLVAQGKINEGIGVLSPAAAVHRPSAADAKQPDNADIFSLISDIFQPTDHDAAPRTPPSAAAPPKTPKLMIPVSDVHPEPQPSADIEKTLSKLAPAARTNTTEGSRHGTPIATEIAAIPEPKPLQTAAVPERAEPAFRGKEAADRTDLSLRRDRPTPAVAGSATRFKVQLAAYRHLKHAIRGKKLLARALPAHFPQLAVFVRETPGSKSSRTNYRLRSNDSIDRNQADDYCTQARSAGLACLVIQPTSSAWQPVHSNSVANRTDTPAAGHRSGHPEDDVGRHAAVTSAAAIDGKTSETTARAGSDGPQYRIQLAAYRHLKNAIRGKQILARLLPHGFPDLDILKRSGSANRQAPIDFRIRSSAPWTKSRARKFCDNARATGVSCLLIRHGVRRWRSVSLTKPLHASLESIGRVSPQILHRTHLVAAR